MTFSAFIKFCREKVFAEQFWHELRDWHNVDIWYIHRGDRTDTLDIGSILGMREHPKKNKFYFNLLDKYLQIV